MKTWMWRWFPVVWPEQQRRFRVAGEYRALASSQHMLSDLCMRNNVFAPLEPRPDRAPNMFDLGVAEGRRQCVLEILELARTDPNSIAELQLRDTTPTRGERHVE